MKRLFKSTLVVCLLLCMVLGLSACGGKPLTEENVVGRYQIVQVVYTPAEENTHGFTRAVNLTRADFEAIVARKDAGTSTAQDDEDYMYYGSYFDCVTEVRADGSIYDYHGDSPEMLNGYWEIRDGKLEYNCEYNDIDQYTAEWDNGKIKITCTVTRSDQFQGVEYYILERVA